jgi:hypothetical protein
VSDPDPTKSAQPKRLVPVVNLEDERFLQSVKAQVFRHRRLRIFGLLAILTLLTIVYPLLVFLDGRAIAGWRKAQLPGSEAAVVPAQPTRSIVIEVSAKRMLVTAVNGTFAVVPIVPPAAQASGTSHIVTWKPGSMLLGGPYACIERGTAGILRALGRPSLFAAHADRCLRIDGDVYDALFNHTTRETIVEFR